MVPSKSWGNNWIVRRLEKMCKVYKAVLELPCWPFMVCVFCAPRIDGRTRRILSRCRGFAKEAEGDVY